MKVTWGGFQEYRKEGNYEYATVNRKETLFGIFVRRAVVYLFRGPCDSGWRDISTGYYYDSADLNCLYHAYLARTYSVTFRENARIASMVHVVPTADSREHNETGPCWCNPEIKDGVVIHNSADGREAEEEAAEAAASK